MKNILYGIIALVAIFSSSAFAQPTGATDPCGTSVFYYGSTPTAGQWLACLNSLERALGYVPLNVTGGVLLGQLGVQQVYGASGTPTVAAGTGAGTSPTVTLTNAHDTSFGISILTGSAPATSAVIATVTFSVPWPVAMHCTMSPSNANAAGLGASVRPYSAAGLSVGSTYPTWVVTSAATGLTASTIYTWDVLCQ